MNSIQIFGVILVLLMIPLIGVFSSSHVKNTEDFEMAGGKGNAGLVSGLMLGAMLGASYTIGTAQLAYSQGISAFWYTLSNSFSCLLLAFVYTKQFRHARAQTLLGVIRLEYGPRIELTVSLLACMATFVSLIAQLIASSAVLPVIFSGITVPLSVTLTAVLMLVYVVFGGAISAGKIGRVKVTLLYVTVLVGTYIVLKETGLRTLWNTLDHNTYFNFFANGISKEVSKALSVILGAATAQVYMHAIMAGLSDKTSQRGLFMSAVLIPPVGLASVLIGMFMRINHPAIENAKDVFPQFVLLYMPDLLAGIVMGTLLLAIIGSGAAATMEISTIVYRDIIGPRTHHLNSSKTALLFTRFCIVSLLAVGCFLSTGLLGDTVLTFTSAAIGLRTASMFVPLMCAMFFSGKIDRHWVFISLIVGTALALLFSLWDVLPIDGLAAGFLGSILCCLFGAVSKKIHVNKIHIIN